MKRLAASLLAALGAAAQASADEPASWTRRDLKSLAARIAAEEGVSPILFDALIAQESNYSVDAVSPKGAMSLAQLMPATARELGLDEDEHFDPEANLRGGARYLRSLLDEAGEVSLALGAYNAGMKRVRDRPFEEWPRETREFVAAILKKAGPQSAARRVIGSIMSMPKPDAATVANSRVGDSPADGAREASAITPSGRQEKDIGNEAPGFADLEPAPASDRFANDSMNDSEHGLIIDLSILQNLSKGATS